MRREEGCADDKSAREEGAERGRLQDQKPRVADEPAEAGRVHACLYDHAEKTKFGSPESRPREVDQRDGSHYVHSGSGP